MASAAVSARFLASLSERAWLCSVESGKSLMGGQALTCTIEVTRARRRSFLTENQSTYIPIGEKHRLGNPGKTPPFLIEVQSGAYLEEHDIVRFEDIYRRSSTE
jgi:Mannose-6-phosphate isomerase C-terminal